MDIITRDEIVQRLWDIRVDCPNRETQQQIVDLIDEINKYED